MQLNMVQKRPFDAEQIFEVSLKHPKQVEPSDQLISFPKSVFPEDAFQSLKTSGGSLVEDHEKLIINTVIWN